MSDQPPPTDQPSPESQPETPQSSAAPPTGGESSKDERNLALLAHILGFFTSVLVPLIVWLLKKDSSKFLDHHGKQALNFQITMLIGWIIASITTPLFGLGCIIGAVVFVVNIVFCIIAAVAASKGEWYRYPIAIPLLK